MAYRGGYDSQEITAELERKIRKEKKRTSRKNEKKIGERHAKTFYGKLIV